MKKKAILSVMLCAMLINLGLGAGGFVVGAYGIYGEKNESHDSAMVRDFKGEKPLKYSKNQSDANLIVGPKAPQDTFGQDSFEMRESEDGTTGVVVFADGTGTHGKKASSFCARTMAEQLLKQGPQRAKEILLGLPAKYKKSVSAYISTEYSDYYEQYFENYAGGDTTLAFLYVDNNQVTLGNFGDSRVLKISVGTGAYSHLEEHGGGVNIGIFPLDEHESKFVLESGHSSDDIYILMSDGLYNGLGEDDDVAQSDADKTIVEHVKRRIEGENITTELLNAVARELVVKATESTSMQGKGDRFDDITAVILVPDKSALSIEQRGALGLNEYGTVQESLFAQFADKQKRVLDNVFDLVAQNKRQQAYDVLRSFSQEVKMSLLDLKHKNDITDELLSTYLLYLDDFKPMLPNYENVSQLAADLSSDSDPGHGLSPEDAPSSSSSKKRIASEPEKRQPFVSEHKASIAIAGIIGAALGIRYLRKNWRRWFGKKTKPAPPKPMKQSKPASPSGTYQF